jgi:hypothetical protein
MTEQQTNWFKNDIEMVYDTEIMDISVNQQPFSPNVFKFSNIYKIAFLDLDVFGVIWLYL